MGEVGYVSLQRKRLNIIVLVPCTRSHFQQTLVQLTNARLNIMCIYFVVNVINTILVIHGFSVHLRP